MDLRIYPFSSGERFQKMECIELMKFLFYFCIISVFFSIFPETPSFQTTKDRFLSSDSLLLDRNGEILQEFRILDSERKLNWIHLSEVSVFFLNALLVAEDKRFFSHSGVDWVAMGSGAFRLLIGGNPRGASTITMQLASILEPSLKAKNRWRTFSQKWYQISAAMAIETNWTKEEILEAYINLVSYRGELVGIHSASRGIFGKDPHGLTFEEGILLASMIKTPSGTIPRLKERACHLQSLIDPLKDCTEIAEWLESILSKPYKIQSIHKNAKWIPSRLGKNANRNNKSTLDKNLQLFATEALRKQLVQLKKNHVLDGAVLIKNNETDEILAYVGNGGDLSSASEVDGVMAKRQSGSTLKPFLYALAFEKKLLTPSSLLDDRPTEIQVGTGIYIPSNYESKYNGSVTARIALSSSLNIPAVHVLEIVGTDDFLEFLSSIGFSELESPEHYGLSIALGSLDVNLWDLVNAYSIFPKKGNFRLQSLTNSESQKKGSVLSPESAFLISHILGDRDSRALTFGLETPLSTRFPSSVKTGTSKDMKDNWCVGFSTRYTVGVWVGNFTGDPMWNVSGITGAAPIWAEIMEYLHKDTPVSSYIAPSGIKEVIHSIEGGSEVTEYYIYGTEPIALPKPSQKIINRIQSPITDAVIALDPDIPLDRQKVFFEPKFFSKELSWNLNGEILGSAKEIYFWIPIRGDHTLELFYQDILLDKIHFKVK
jgi:penicillin-binding protein 1C